MEGPQIAAYLSTADVGLSADPLSPLNDVSTMNKTLEYMAFGLPVVAYDLKETRVSAGPAAVYVTPNEIDAYAEADRRPARRSGRTAERGAAGRSRIEETFSWQRQGRGTFEVFDRLEGVSEQVSVQRHWREVSMKVAILAGGRRHSARRGDGHEAEADGRDRRRSRSSGTS